MAGMAERPAYPAAQPHGAPEEIWPDIFLVRGSMRLAPGMRISRNMLVLRHAGELLLVNPIRLSTAGEAQLEALGRVRHVMRLGAFHGLDDAYCCQRFGAAFWCQRHSRRYPAPRVERPLSEGVDLPMPDAELFVFRQTRLPESALLLRRHGGLLMTCDSVQYYASWDRHSLGARLVMRLAGFRRAALVGPFWLRSMRPRRGSLQADFERLLRLEFRHLVAAHGDLLRDEAKPAVVQAVAAATLG